MREICEISHVLAQWTPQKNAADFRTVMNEQTLEVYLQKETEHANCLVKISGFFRILRNTQFTESTEEYFKLRNEELREFLCMLCFIESHKLILHKVNILDMYKIAYHYNIPILHEKCKKCIEKFVSETVLSILNFAIFYYDKDLEKFAQFCFSELPQTTEDEFSESEIFHEFENEFVIDTGHVSNFLIKSASDFWKYLTELRNMVKGSSEISASKVVPYIPTNKPDPELFDFYK